MLRLLVEFERKVETEDKSSLVPSNPPGRVSSKRRPDGSNATTELTKKATARTLKFTVESESASVNLSLSDQAMAIPHESGILRFLLENADISSAARTSRTWNQFSGSVSRVNFSDHGVGDLPHIGAAKRGDLDYIIFLQRRHTQGLYKWAVFADPQLLNQAAAHGRLHIVQYLHENARFDVERSRELDQWACEVNGKAECFRYVCANYPPSPLELCAKEAISAGNIECYQAVMDLARVPYRRHLTASAPWPHLLEIAIENRRVEFLSRFRDQYVEYVDGQPLERYQELMLSAFAIEKLEILKFIDEITPFLDSKLKAPIQYERMLRLLVGGTTTDLQQAFECFRYLYEQIERDLDAKKIKQVIDAATNKGLSLVMKYLLDRGVKVVDAFTAIFYAAAQPTREMLVILHEHGVPWPTGEARVDYVNRTVLMCAVTNGERSVDCFRYILESDWCTDEPDVRLLPLGLSSGAPLELLEYLFEKGYPLAIDDQQEPRLSDPLCFNRESIRPEVFFWALSKGCPYFDDEHRDHSTPTLCEIAARDTRDSAENMRLACGYYVENGLDIAWGMSFWHNYAKLNWQALRFSLRNGCPPPRSVYHAVGAAMRLRPEFHLSDAMGHPMFSAQNLEALRNITTPPLPWLDGGDDVNVNQSQHATFILKVVSAVSNPERADAFSYVIRGGCPMAVEVACRVAIEGSWVEGIRRATDAGASRTIEDSNLALMARSSACFSYMMQDGFPRPTDGEIIANFLMQANVFFLRVAHRFGIVGSDENDIACIMDAAQDALRKGSIVDDACLTYALENSFPLPKRFWDTVAKNRSLRHLRNLVQSGSSQNSSMFYS